MAIPTEDLATVRLFINDRTAPFRYTDPQISIIYDRALRNIYTTTAHILMAEVLRYTLPVKPTPTALPPMPTLPVLPPLPPAPTFLSAHDLSAYQARLTAHRTEASWNREQHQAQLADHRLRADWEREQYQSRMATYRSEIELLRMDIDLRQRLIQHWLTTAEGVV